MYNYMNIGADKVARRAAELLRNALDLFHETTGLELVPEAEKVRDDAGLGTDTLLRLQTPGGERNFAVAARPRLTVETLGAAVHQLGHFPHKGMIVTDYVNPRMAERLKEMNIPFLDAVGNAYLNEPPVYVYIRGNKPQKKAPGEVATRAFRPAGLKVLFVLLCQPELAGAPYRQIAHAAGVALGTVGWVITDLKAQGFLVDRGTRGRRLVNREALLERWVTAWPEQLRPRLLTGRYQAANPDWWKQARLHDYQACWGGEVAAAKLTHYLKPERVTIYAWDKAGQLLFANKLKKHPGGEVELLEAFWQLDDRWQQRELAPPLIVYADLLATGDARNIETAGMIYEQELAGLVGEY